MLGNVLAEGAEAKDANEANEADGPVTPPLDHFQATTPTGSRAAEDRFAGDVPGHPGLSPDKVGHTFLLISLTCITATLFCRVHLCMWARHLVVFDMIAWRVRGTRSRPHGA